jgi:hypothetical protein
MRRRWLTPLATAIALALIGAMAVPTPAAASGGRAPLPRGTTALTGAGLAGNQTNTISPRSSTACGRACDFKDPETYYPYPHSNVRCVNDAVPRFDGETEHVTLMYSPRCETTWVLRRSLFVDAVYQFSEYPDGNWRTWTCCEQDYSMMLDDHGFLNYACARWYYNEWDLAAGTNAQYECTKKY